MKVLFIHSNTACIIVVLQFATAVQYVMGIKLIKHSGSKDGS